MSVLAGASRGEPPARSRFGCQVAPSRLNRAGGHLREKLCHRSHCVSGRRRSRRHLRSAVQNFWTIGRHDDGTGRTLRRIDRHNHFTGRTSWRMGRDCGGTIRRGCTAHRNRRRRSWQRGFPSETRDSPARQPGAVVETAGPVTDTAGEVIGTVGEPCGTAGERGATTGERGGTPEI